MEIRLLFIAVLLTVALDQNIDNCALCTSQLSGDLVLTGYCRDNALVTGSADRIGDNVVEGYYEFTVDWVVIVA